MTISTLRALVSASGYALRVIPWGGGWVRGPALVCPARDRTTARLMRLVNAGLAEHETRQGYRPDARHHYWRATDQAREAVKSGALQ